MAGINFNPQPMNNWKLNAKSKKENNQEQPKPGNFNPQPINNWELNTKSKEENNQEPPKTGNINDFMNTKEGQAFLAAFNRNKANQP